MCAIASPLICRGLNSDSISIIALLLFLSLLLVFHADVIYNASFKSVIVMFLLCPVIGNLWSLVNDRYIELGFADYNLNNSR